MLQQDASSELRTASGEAKLQCCYLLMRHRYEPLMTCTPLPSSDSECPACNHIDMLWGQCPAAPASAVPVVLL